MANCQEKLLLKFYDYLTSQKDNLLLEITIILIRYQFQLE